MENNNFLKGFTLVEVLVSVSITTLIMSVVLFSYSEFSNNLALSGAKQEIAISIRKAQTYGLSVKEASVGGGQFGLAYGIYFNPTLNPSDYFIFVDKDGDRIYDADNGCGNTPTECIERVSIRDNVTISAICDLTDCPPFNSTSLHITFLRPNPDAIIKFVNAGGPILGIFSGARIVLSSPKGNVSTTTVDITGQVSI